MDLPSIHVPSEIMRDVKSACTTREALVCSRTELINCVRGTLRTRRVALLKTGGAERFPTRARRQLIEQPDGLPIYIDRLLITIESLNEQIAQADEEVRWLAKNDDICVLLIPVGSGPPRQRRSRPRGERADPAPTMTHMLVSRIARGSSLLFTAETSVRLMTHCSWSTSSPARRAGQEGGLNVCLRFLGSDGFVVAPGLSEEGFVVTAGQGPF